MEAAENKRLLDITAGEFAEILADKIAAKITINGKDAATTANDVIEGLKGLSEYLNISENKLWRLRQKGKLTEAETQVGPRKFYYSRLKIDKIFK